MIKKNLDSFKKILINNKSIGFLIELMEYIDISKTLEINNNKYYFIIGGGTSKIIENFLNYDEENNFSISRTSNDIDLSIVSWTPLQRKLSSDNEPIKHLKEMLNSINGIEFVLNKSDSSSAIRGFNLYFCKKEIKKDLNFPKESNDGFFFIEIFIKTVHDMNDENDIVRNYQKIKLISPEIIYLDKIIIISKLTFNNLEKFYDTRHLFDLHDSRTLKVKDFKFLEKYFERAISSDSIYGKKWSDSSENKDLKNQIFDNVFNNLKFLLIYDKKSRNYKNLEAFNKNLNEIIPGFLLNHKDIREITKKIKEIKKIILTNE